MTQDPTRSPAEAPQLVDDGGADHLAGRRMPGIALPSIDGGQLRVDTVPEGFKRLVLYAYPLTGRPDVDNPEGWDEILGARGCTPESCGFRDHAADLADVGAAVVGVSTQSSDYQREAAERLSLPYLLLSDHGLQLTHALSLPTMNLEVRDVHDGGGRKILLKRLTLVVRDRVIEYAFYPVFSPERHAAQVLAWLDTGHNGTQHA